MNQITSPTDFLCSGIRATKGKKQSGSSVQVGIVSESSDLTRYIEKKAGFVYHPTYK